LSSLSFTLIACEPSRSRCFSSVARTAGPAGLYVEHPTFITHLAGAPGTPTATFADAVLNIPPNGEAVLGSGVIFIDGTTTLSVRFDAIGPYRP
jgi:hypothetical protein